MTLDCLVSNPFEKTNVFHQDYINIRSLIIIYFQEKALYLNLKNVS